MDGILIKASSFVIAQWLFLKLLAVIYFFAFWSLLVQVKGLYGAKGIAPIRDLLDDIKNTMNKRPFFRIPTIFWWNASDLFLQGTAIFGIIISLLIVIGMPVTPFLFFLLWLTYLSFVTVDSVFLSFQWDSLLLETGFMAIFFSIQTPPLMLWIFLLWFFLFRFIFSSGIAKVLATLPQWRNLKAMCYHFETQPLPTKLAYYAHQLSKILGRLLTATTLIFELGVPFLIFGFSFIRLIGFSLLVLFQVFIFLTGNYAFFNLLSVVLCFPLLEDRYLQWMIDGFQVISIGSSYSLSMQVFLALIAGFLFLLNMMQLIGIFIPVPIFYRLMRFIGPYYIVNSYGLFAHMTIRRPEIIVEGSEDGLHWKEYEFKWKPDNLFKPPKQVAPHQPRLDWQMWFAALDHYYNNPWFMNFLILLLEGSKPVLNLLGTNPFPDIPPKFVRARLYDYHFSDWKTKQATGQWWTRTLKGVYMPAISIRDIEKEMHRNHVILDTE